MVVEESNKYYIILFAPFGGLAFFRNYARYRGMSARQESIRYEVRMQDDRLVLAHGSRPADTQESVARLAHPSDPGRIVSNGMLPY